jgi:hypothetical protein
MKGFWFGVLRYVPLKTAKNRFGVIVFAVPIICATLARGVKSTQNERIAMPQSGKIARFPASIREELNQRLFNGE